MMMGNIDKELEFFKEWDKKALRNDDFGNVYSVDINSAISMAKNRVREVILKLTHSKTSKEEIRFSLLRMGTLFLDVKIGQNKKLDDFYVLFENGILKKEHYLLYQNGIRVLEAVNYVLSIIYMRNRSFLERIDIPSLKYFNCSYKEITEECLSKWEDRFENGIIALQKKRSGGEVELKDVPSFIQELEIEVFKFGEAFSLKECHSQLSSLRTNMQYSSLANVLLATLFKVYALPKENSIQEEFYKKLVKRVECLLVELLNTINHQLDIESSIKNIFCFLLEINIANEIVIPFLEKRLLLRVNAVEDSSAKQKLMDDEISFFNQGQLEERNKEFQVNHVKLTSQNGLPQYLDLVVKICNELLGVDKILWTGTATDFVDCFSDMIMQGCFKRNGKIIYPPIYWELYQKFQVVEEGKEISFDELSAYFKQSNWHKDSLLLDTRRDYFLNTKIVWTNHPIFFIESFKQIIEKGFLKINNEIVYDPIIEKLYGIFYIPKNKGKGEIQLGSLKKYLVDINNSIKRY